MTKIYIGDIVLNVYSVKPVFLHSFLKHRLNLRDYKPYSIKRFTECTSDGASDDKSSVWLNTPSFFVKNFMYLGDHTVHHHSQDQAI